MSEDDILTETQIAAINAARRSLVATIERLIGNDQRRIVQLVFIAVSGLFADLLAVSASVMSDAKFTDMINQQLAESGWQLTRIRH
jgi:hypothetical protein